MILNDDIKAKIQAEYDSWRDKLWAGKTKEERQKLGQFATPPQLTIKMLEKFDSLEGNVLDPCLGAGNLIAAAIIAGADPRKCYGIELDPVVHKVAQLRLSKLGVPPCNIVQGDALDPKSYEEKLRLFEDKSFAVVSKTEDEKFNVIVSSAGNVREAICTRVKANEILKKLKERNVRVFKV